MEVVIDIKNSEIIDALIGAFEGGSNHWYYLPNLKMLKYPAEDTLEANIFYTAMDGVQIPVHDIENPKDLLGYISKENIERGVKMYCEEHGSLIAEEMDADDSDILLQYIVLGEIVYG